VKIGHVCLREPEYSQVRPEDAFEVKSDTAHILVLVWREMEDWCMRTSPGLTADASHVIVAPAFAFEHQHL
jgi:hypothetical protein